MHTSSSATTDQRAFLSFDYSCCKTIGLQNRLTGGEYEEEEEEEEEEQQQQQQQQ